MAINDENYVTRETAQEIIRTIEEVKNLTMRKNRAPNRRVRSVGGGGAERPYVVITAVTDAANYTGNVITSPDDSTVIETGVIIKVPGAVDNEFDVGYKAFSDKVGDNYYIDGYLLG